MQQVPCVTLTLPGGREVDVNLQQSAAIEDDPDRPGKVILYVGAAQLRLKIDRASLKKQLGWTDVVMVPADDAAAASMDAMLAAQPALTPGGLTDL